MSSNVLLLRHHSEQNYELLNVSFRFDIMLQQGLVVRRLLLLLVLLLP